MLDINPLCLQDPILFQSKRVELSNLLQYQSSHPAVPLAKEFIHDFLTRYERNTHEDARNHWDAFICDPEQLASRSGTRVAVIIDEFQDMKFYVRDIDEQTLDRRRGIRDRIPDWQGTDLTATYDRQAQSRKAPMLVSGSAMRRIWKGLKRST